MHACIVLGYMPKRQCLLYVIIWQHYQYNFLMVTLLHECTNDSVGDVKSVKCLTNCTCLCICLCLEVDPFVGAYMTARSAVP
uniref:Uncharacterized protein n=1 Tax=Oryza brachyantha TaxID=4533 RepID=J3MFL8_ORYBR